MLDHDTLLIPPRPAANSRLSPGTTSVPIHPISLWPVGTIPSVHVFPGELDFGRLAGAIQDVSAVWPTIAGRYVRKPERPSDPNESAFFIELTGSPIPLSTKSLTAEQAFQTRDVIQPSISEYLHALDPRYHEANQDCSLVSIRLTTLMPSHKSVLGITWAHILGDASTFNSFTHHLSFFYVNGPGAQLTPRQMPTFFPHIAMPVYPPGSEVLDMYQTTQVYPSYTSMDQRKAYGEAIAASVPVLISLSRAELNALVREHTPEGTEFLSTQDILSAWWAGVLERAGYEVNKIIYTVNYRSFHRGSALFPPNLPTLAGNVVQMLRIELPSSLDTAGSRTETDAAEIAHVIRSALDKKRQDPEATIDWLSSIAYRLEEAAEKGRCQVVLPDKGEVLVNSNLRYNWVISFGFPWDETAFHTAFTAPWFLRVYEANPNPGEKYGETNVELAFNVAKGGEGKRRVEDILAEYRLKWSANVQSDHGR